MVAFALTVICVAGILLWARKPSGEGDWSPDQAVLPYAEIYGDTIMLHNIRNIEYRTVSDYTPRYHDRSFYISDVVSADLGVAPLLVYKRAAHTFVSFGLKDGTHIVVSIEARRRKGARYSPLRGLFRQFGLIYIIADERDVIRVRSNFRKGDVYLYPVEASAKKIQKLFVDMMQRANTLKKHPEFYNSFTNSCTSNLAKHVNAISPGHIPFSVRIPLSTGVDRLAHKLGLIGTSMTFPEMKKVHRVTERARSAHHDPEFSKRIRSH